VEISVHSERFDSERVFSVYAKMFVHGSVTEPDVREGTVRLTRVD
jgi:hypothetical protein